MQEFKIGDILQLKSGGPKMTIEKIDQFLGQTSVHCQWFAGGKLSNGEFLPELLVRVADEKKEESQG